MSVIKSSVGKGGVNRSDDVRIVQDLLNKSTFPPRPPLKVDGNVGPRTFAAIEAFQRAVMKLPQADGRIDPGGKTLQSLIGSKASVPKPVTAETIQPPSSPVRIGGRGLPVAGKAPPLMAMDYERAAERIGCDVACIMAVTEVESRGGGFYPSGRPLILFEAHVFSRRTQRKWDKAYPDISSVTWNTKLYKRGELEYERLEKAMALDRRAALESASWGLFQIMGFNCQKAGFATIDDYVEAMFESEGRQLDAFVNFLMASQLVEPLRNKRWAEFAKGYNGPAYKDNKYDIKLQTAYASFSKPRTS